MINPFSTIKSAAITVVVIAAVTFCGTMWVQKNLAERESAKLQVKIGELETSLFASQIRAKGLEIVVKNLEEVNKIIASNVKEEQAIEKEIENAPESDDGPVAPVLRRTLDGVDRMLGHNN